MVRGNDLAGDQEQVAGRPEERAPVALDAETARVRRFYDRIAPAYHPVVALFDKVLVGDGCGWIGSQVSGDVLEIAIGTGRSLPHYYPEGVRLTGVDVSARMLAIARQRAERLGRQVELRLGDAQALEFPDEAFDAVVGDALALHDS